MTKFDELQQKAKKLSGRLAEKYTQHLGCFTFFSALVHNKTVLHDAAVITLLANSLDEQYDKDFKGYFSDSIKNFDVFKEQILTGIYLVKWFQYNTILDSYFYKSLVDLFRNHLGEQSLEAMDKTKFYLCLDSLSRYCSYVYYNDKKGLNYNLNISLGLEIQLHIHKAYNVSFTNESTLQCRDVYTGINEFI